MSGSSRHAVTTGFLAFAAMTASGATGVISADGHLAGALAFGLMALGMAYMAVGTLRETIALAVLEERHRNDLAELHRIAPKDKE